MCYCEQQFIAFVCLCSSSTTTNICTVIHLDDCCRALTLHKLSTHSCHHFNSFDPTQLYSGLGCCHRGWGHMCLFKQRHDMSCVLHRSSGILKLAETLTRYVQTGLRAGNARRMPSTWLVMTHGWVPAGSVVRHVKFALTMIAAAKHRIECELVTCLY